MYRGWNRNLSIMKHLLKRASEMEPSMRCRADTVQQFQAWKAQFKAKLDELLGPFPQRVQPNPRTVARIERENDFVEKFVIDVEHDLAAPGYLLLPKDLKKGQKRPAILCCHGHDRGAKAMAAGLEESPHRKNKEYARLMTERGYITAIIDHRGFGERSFPFTAEYPRCNELYLLYAMLGYQLITLNLHDNLQALEFLLRRPEVDTERVGVLGQSFGGTMAQYVGVYDERVRAVCIDCYLSTTLEYTFEDVDNNCGSQFVPGLYRYGDVATVAGLIAPRPVLVQSGFADGCFTIDSAAKAHEELRSIYRAAGAEDRLTVDILDGGHEFNPATAYAFFDRSIGPAR